MDSWAKDALNLLKRCEDVIKSFNPVIHSIDTHCREKLGPYDQPDAKPDLVFVQQVVYGWYRERVVIEAFVKNFYEDNASRLLRADRTFYAIFAYLVIFRIDEMTYPVFKDMVLSQDPIKMYNFISYLFNEENLNSCLKEDWIKVRDLSFVEDEMIATIEHHLPHIKSLLKDLESKALGQASIKAAIEDSKKKGTFGLKGKEKRELTRPVSPKITPPAITMIPEPIFIDNNVKANPVPSNLKKISLADLEQQRTQSLEVQRQAVQKKYENSSSSIQSLLTKRSSKYTSKFEELKKDVELSQQQQLAFDSSFVNIPPDFSKNPATIKNNKAAILREDYLFRKQQELDVQAIKKYEEELRDASEFYQWQAEMKEQDEEAKLKEVQRRRDQAKQAAIEAKESIQRLHEDNRQVADLIREQEDIIKHRKEIDSQLELLANRMAAASIAEARDKNPKLAIEQLHQAKYTEGKKLRDELEEARKKKEMDEKREQEELNDKIRQQRALNTVHKKVIKVFDPTEIYSAISGSCGFLCEMSYMEMKERLEQERKKYEELESKKRQEILEAKEKNAKDLEGRALQIQKLREKRAGATKIFYEDKARIEREREIQEEKARQESALKLAEELKTKREEKKRIAEALEIEEERIKRQQQYLGAAVGAVEEKKYKELLLAKERHERELQEQIKLQALADAKAKASDVSNRKTLKSNEIVAKTKMTIEQEKEVISEKKLALSRLRTQYEEKKAMVASGKIQHSKTKQAIISNNPYASTITGEIHEQSKRFRTMAIKNLI